MLVSHTSLRLPFVLTLFNFACVYVVSEDHVRQGYRENTDNISGKHGLLFHIGLLLYKMGDMIFFSFSALIAFCRIFYVSVSALSVSMWSVFSR